MSRSDSNGLVASGSFKPYFTCDRNTDARTRGVCLRVLDGVCAFAATSMFRVMSAAAWCFSDLCVRGDVVSVLCVRGDMDVSALCVRSNVVSVPCVRSDGDVSALCVPCDLVSVPHASGDICVFDVERHCWSSRSVCLCSDLGVRDLRLQLSVSRGVFQISNVVEICTRVGVLEIFISYRSLK